MYQKEYCCKMRENRFKYDAEKRRELCRAFVSRADGLFSPIYIMLSPRAKMRRCYLNELAAFTFQERRLDVYIIIIIIGARRCRLSIEKAPRDERRYCKALLIAPALEMITIGHILVMMTEGASAAAANICRRERMAPFAQVRLMSPPGITLYAAKRHFA